MTTPRTFEARSEAAYPVGAAINEAKISINHSIVRIGELISNIGHARLTKNAHMPMTVGMAAAEEAAQAAGALAAAYRHSVEAHRHLSADKDALGLTTVAWGDLWDTYPKSEASAREVAELRAVA